MSTTAPAVPESTYRVYGTVRDQYQRPLARARVDVFDRDIRSLQKLGSAVTDERGAYQVRYSRSEFARQDKQAADIVVQVFSADGTKLQETPTTFNASAELQVDIDLATRPYAGLSELERVLATVEPVIAPLPPAQLTETSDHADLSFLVNKTGLSRDVLEDFAMAYQWAATTRVMQAAYYGILRQSTTHPVVQSIAGTAPTNFASRANQAFAQLMTTGIDDLMAGVNGALDANLIPLSLTPRLQEIRRELLAAQETYRKQHPPGPAPELVMKLQIAGVPDARLAPIGQLFAQNPVTATVWKTLEQDPAFTTERTALLETVFSLSQLTGEQVLLTDQLVQQQNIRSPADLPRLAANTAATWTTLLDQGKITPPDGIPGTTPAERTQNYATQLEARFTGEIGRASCRERV